MTWNGMGGGMEWDIKRTGTHITWGQFTCATPGVAVVLD